MRLPTTARAVALLSALSLMSGCLSSKLKDPTPKLAIGSVPGTWVLADMSVEKGLTTDSLKGVKPIDLNRALRKEYSGSGLFSSFYFERDLSTKGLNANGPTYLLKVRMEQIDSKVVAGQGALVAVLVAGIVTLGLGVAFIGLVRQEHEVRYSLRFQIYDVTQARIERVKDEATADFFNSYNVSALTPVAAGEHEVSINYLAGFDSAEHAREQLQLRLTEFARRWITAVEPAVRRAAANSTAHASAQ